ncbi:MAG: urea carboxylase [Herbiconiux sp.]|uniref:urea carboxylase n=1 Tax=Herbiconiux sp. TaxID=1871186 RepID=UPI00120E3067|nr:urea carboxylase [Herbiconiux sp.]TAJ48101.1 MAG: urea carboxylase [Herbiconiux sp.]
MSTAPAELGYTTLLVANRGEIACRIIRSARSLGLRTVAVFSDADRAAPHVTLADEAVHIGPASPRESYLDAARIIRAALQSGAGAIHPGYGFLSENAEFARAAEAAGIVFVGPTPEQLSMFGAKDAARRAAAAAGLPMVRGTEVLADVEEALDAAEELGFPIILKATGGGGGIGMQVCRSRDEVAEAFPAIQRVAQQSFGSGAVFAERFIENARHVEVQVFGDGRGGVVSLGDRDCSLQRRNQKVVEEAPAFDLDDALRERLHATARALCASVGYRSAATVEFVYDSERQEASFLEVNTRLQVEHPVTEVVTGVDLVDWMLRLAGGDDSFLVPYRDGGVVPVSGFAVEARVYAEDPNRGYQPSAGVITQAVFPEASAARVDGWVSTGTEVSSVYDPMLAKVITGGSSRAEAWDALADALAGTRIDGIETNLGLLRALAVEPLVRERSHSTATLAGLADPEPRITVLRPGLLTTVQDWPGRTGYWQIGVPPSGPMDDLSFRLGNVALGNPEGAPGLECTATGPRLQFTQTTRVAVTGAPVVVTVDGEPAPMWEPVVVPAGGVLDLGAATDVGLRTYVLFDGGLDVPDYLGSRSTFTLGQFGGHGGRALVGTDVLRVAPSRGGDPRTEAAAGAPGLPSAGAIAMDVRPALVHAWELAVSEGPHAAPEFFTRADIDQLFSSDYEVHFNSARTGVRLVGPKPAWARSDGGEAGLHPSNIHDNAYSVGALDFTGDTPILLGPDGPSLGGFVCPVTVVAAERWKLGQLKPGDTVRFVPVPAERAPALSQLGVARAAAHPRVARIGRDDDDGVIARTDGSPAVTYRRSGDDNVLVEYGDIVLDLGLRARVHALHQLLESERIAGVRDLTPGIRSLQVHVDPEVLPISTLIGLLMDREQLIPDTASLVVPSRRVRLPLSWDDPATREAIERYMNGVRDDAPWTPWNIEFIRRINGLADVDEVYRTVFDAEYLVLGLGDVYLGAPVATPLDPRHRLVTTKYNPARTWTAENSVGIGGAYLCIYGMEGPGGYQFVGRTTQVWSRFGSFAGSGGGNGRADAPSGDRRPWLLDFFDRISWFPVSAEELLDRRADIAAGRAEFDIEDGTFSLAEYSGFLDENADSIAAFRAKQAVAFAEERAAWERSGEFDRAEAVEVVVEPEAFDAVPEGSVSVDAPFVAHVWKLGVTEGQRVEAGDLLVSLEAMKMETNLLSPVTGVVQQLRVGLGRQVRAGETVAVVVPE